VPAPADSFCPKQSGVASKTKRPHQIDQAFCMKGDLESPHLLASRHRFINGGAVRSSCAKAAKISSKFGVCPSDLKRTSVKYVDEISDGPVGVVLWLRVPEPYLVIVCSFIYASHLFCLIMISSG
jgi:hypothetical protein